MDKHKPLAIFSSLTYPPFQLFIFIAATVIGLISSGCESRRSNVPDYIATLDSLLNIDNEFEIRQLTRIAEIKQKHSQAKTPAEKYFYDDLLYHSFYPMSADSALFYANQSIESAKLTGNREWLTSSIINKSTVLASTGLLKAALEQMDLIDRQNLSKEELIKYYGQMIYLYSRLSNYEGGKQNRYYIKELLYRDSIMNVIDEQHPEFLWYKAWSLLGTQQNPDSTIDALHVALASSRLNTREDAKKAYALARLYKQKGDLDQYENFLAVSAIIDVRIANSEIAALEDLARYRYKKGEGDIDRSYRYIQYCLDKALSYPNRSRAFGISKSLHKINDTYQAQIQRQQHNTKVFLILVCILAGILILAIIAIILQNKKVNSHRKYLDEANEKLNQKVNQLSEADAKLSEMNRRLLALNDDLKAKNNQLYEANFVKEEYIGYVFNLCSIYLSKIAELKRNIYLKIVKRQYKQIEEETSNIDMKDELKEFYHSFDTIFLNLYPNFVNDFNSLLDPDKPSVLKEGELLNMELRIYALVRLGINDSVKIAEFLHCAAQTVYNYRLKVRNRSLYDKANFLSRVRSIGNFLGGDSNIIQIK
ncbi:MAG: transcriptional regulator [Muribaculaceae bacterium]|nr:transcriptional regulator [Muribaculaceae bacterium]